MTGGVKNLKSILAGVDEAGRGCLAGPVVAGAVILPEQFDLPGLTDSKQLSPAKRDVLALAIKKQAVAWSVGLAWPKEIDQVNILKATLQAMARAVRQLKIHPTALAIDGNQTIPMDIPQEAVVHGDALIPAISAASILAKTFRDRLLIHLDKRYPGYGFAEHKGYGTADHLQALLVLGPCPMHRMTFRRVKPEPKDHQLWLPGI